MSNYLAIATVTATLQTILGEIIAGVEAAGPKNVTIVRPDKTVDRDALGLNLYLYRTSVNSTFRSHDTPMRNGHGQLVNDPTAGFDLDYLFTFYGPSIEAQSLLGQTLAALHAEPYLTSSRIEEGIKKAVAKDAKSPIRQSDLAEQVEPILLTPIPLELEELSKLWSVFLQVPYDLSIAYRVSVVLVSADIRGTTAT